MTCALFLIITQSVCFFQAGAWVVLGIFSLIRFQADYVLVIGVCLTLCVANIIGFTKCRKGTSIYARPEWYRFEVIVFGNSFECGSFLLETSTKPNIKATGNKSVTGEKWDLDGITNLWFSYITNTCNSKSRNVAHKIPLQNMKYATSLPTKYLKNFIVSK